MLALSSGNLLKYASHMEGTPITRLPAQLLLGPLASRRLAAELLPSRDDVLLQRADDCVGSGSRVRELCSVLRRHSSLCARDEALPRATGHQRMKCYSKRDCMKLK